MQSNGAMPFSFGAITASNVAADAFTAHESAPVPDECPPPVMVDESPSTAAERFTSDGPPVASGARHGAVETSSPVRTIGFEGYASMKIFREPTLFSIGFRPDDRNTD